MTPLEKPIHRVTRGALDRTHGPDSGRKLVITLEIGDLIVLRPYGTRRPEKLDAFDAYQYALKRRVNCERLEKAREKKAKLASRRRSR